MSRVHAGTAIGSAGRLALGRSSRGGGLVLCYHDVEDTAEPTLALNVTVEQLRHHLLQARRLGFTFVDLGVLTRRALAGQDVSGLAAVTFDDALAGVGRHAVPVLVELGVPATALAVSRRLGLSPDWWPGAAPTMTAHELVEARELGLRIGAHSRTHASLPSLGGAALRDEVSGCRADLEDLLGVGVDLFAYPFGHHDQQVRDEVARAGYEAAFTFLNGRIRGGEDRWQLPRLTMGRHHTSWRLAYHLARPARSWPTHQLAEVTGG